MRKLILRNGLFVAVDVRTPCPALWENNPHLTPVADGAAGAEEINVGEKGAER